jgi:hypothetical protein
MMVQHAGWLPEWTATIDFLRVTPNLNCLLWLSRLQPLQILADCLLGPVRPRLPAIARATTQREGGCPKATGPR